MNVTFSITISSPSETVKQELENAIQQGLDEVKELTNNDLSEEGEIYLGDLCITITP